MSETRRERFDRDWNPDRVTVREELSVGEHCNIRPLNHPARACVCARALVCICDEGRVYIHILSIPFFFSLSLSTYTPPLLHLSSNTSPSKDVEPGLPSGVAGEYPKVSKRENL